MTKAPSGLQDLRRRIYAKAKAEPLWRFWGLYVHVCKSETLHAAYLLARSNKGAPGIDGMTFEAIETGIGRERFLEQLRNELTSRTYQPQRNRKLEIPKGEGRKVRVLSIPCIRDRVVQGALRLILEPIFEVDFQSGSYGYRPNRSAHDAIRHVAKEIAYHKTKVIDVDLKAYFDSVQHDVLLAKVAKRVNDDDVMRLRKMIMRATGKRGVPQGGVISPLLSNLYLNEVDRMLEKAREVTRDQYTRIEYARYADDLVILIDGYQRHAWLVQALNKRLREEFRKLGVEVNEEKTRTVDLAEGEAFSFLGFEFRRVRSLRGVWRPHYVPKTKARSSLTRKLALIFRQKRSQPIQELIDRVNPILLGWVKYFAIGHSARCFNFVQTWVEKKVRRHMMRAKKRYGFGWKRWSTSWLYDELQLFNGYSVAESVRKALPAR